MQRIGSRLGSWRTMPITVCACLVVLTAAAAITADEQAHSEAKMRRAALSQRARQQIAEAVDPTIERLQDLAAATGQDRSGSLAGFNAVAKGLLSDPAMSGVGLIELVPARERAMFEREHGEIKALRDGRPSGPAPAQPRYYVVADVLSKPGQPRNIDTNLGEEPARHAVLLAAASTGEPRATPPVHRVGSSGLATVLYVPVYASAGRGASGAPGGRAADLRGFVEQLPLRAARARRPERPPQGHGADVV